MQDYNSLLVQMFDEFPKFKIVNKENSKFMRLCNLALLILSFGRMKTYMTNFVTTVGYTVYVPHEWYLMDREVILRHERIHMLQYKRHGRLWFSFSYLFLLPMFFAYFRTKAEQEAYEESMRADAETFGIDALEDLFYKDRMIKHFTSAQYLWMWIREKDIYNWYDKTVDKLKRELLLKDG